MGESGLREVHRYSTEFKLTAVKLSHLPGVEIQTVANALDLHPFMLSRWRKEVREGVVTGRTRRMDMPSRPTRELKQLPGFIRFYSTRRRKSSSSSIASGHVSR